MTRLDDIAAHGAARSPDRPAIIVPGGATLTYGQLDRRVDGFARSLRRSGSSPGDRLALANCNTPEFFVAFFGAARAGLVAVPLDPGLAAPELQNLVAHARPCAVVVDERSAAAFEPLGVTLHRVDAAADEIAPSETRPSDVGSGESPALVLYTSGTTGAPRGAVHSHAGIRAKVDDIAAWFGLDETHVALCMLPTHFGHGLVCVCLSAFYCGGTLVLCRPFDAELLPRVFALVDRYGVTAFSSVPTVVRLMLRNDAIAPPAADTLRYVTCASAPLHPAEIDAFEHRFGVPLLNCYGSTEAGTWSAMSPNHPDRDRRSVGLVAGCQFRAVSREGDISIPLPIGEVGELEVAGPSLMLGYLDDPDATAAVLRDGWLSTGDIGSVDAFGRVVLAGRSKELIIRAGANIYPAEVESVLLRHPEVVEAYVVGLEHDLLGERVAACVVRRSGAAVCDRDLIRHCRALLAPYKCPETIRFVDAVPKTSRGKVNRASLAALFSSA